jgi:hypothetical protein
MRSLYLFYITLCLPAMCKKERKNRAANSISSDNVVISLLHKGQIKFFF